MDENTVKMNSIQLLQLAEKYMLMGLKALCENALIGKHHWFQCCESRDEDPVLA